jgi:hypothetical protein
MRNLRAFRRAARFGREDLTLTSMGNWWTWRRNASAVLEPKGQAPIAAALLSTRAT